MRVVGRTHRHSQAGCVDAVCRPLASGESRRARMRCKHARRRLAAVDETAPWWVRKALAERLTRLLLGDMSKREQPPDAAILDAFSSNVRARDHATMGGDIDESTTKLVVLTPHARRGAIGAFPVVRPHLSEDVDIGTSVADFYGFGDSSDVALHTAAFLRILLATLAYYAVRAAHEQQSPHSYGQALRTARALATVEARKVSSFWPHLRRRRDADARRRPARD